MQSETANSNTSTQSIAELARYFLIWRVCITLSHILAILSSLFRLYRRRKTRQLWWDDYFAMISLALDCLYFPTLWVRVVNARDAQVATSWVAQIVFPLLIWCTRISLALSIARAIPPQQSMRVTSIRFAYLFGAIGVALTIEVGIACGRNNASWNQIFPYICPLSEGSAISRVSLDIFADASLIIIPFKAFWRQLRLPPITRRLIKACFAASILTAISCVLTTIILFDRHNTQSAEKNAEADFMASIMSHLVASISLLVCNMLVVVTSFYRFFRAEEPIAAIGNLRPPANHNNAPLDMESGVERTTSNTTDGGTDEPPSSEDKHTENATQPTTTSGSYHIELTELFESDFTRPSRDIQTRSLQ
ncbi:hypothetical protein BDZ97DRAFT_142368 [Flammula alnicola]|nr:hypothetical protein BDZ97DRAFT_142368 [Flammula alnicola]